MNHREQILKRVAFHPDRIVTEIRKTYPGLLGSGTHYCSVLREGGAYENARLLPIITGLLDVIEHQQSALLGTPGYVEYEMFVNRAKAKLRAIAEGSGDE